jgi:hypothetical protein
MSEDAHEQEHGDIKIVGIDPLTNHHIIGIWDGICFSRGG